MTIRFIVQARVGSSRLPAKIRKPLGGNTLLAQVVKRLQTAAPDLSQTWPGVQIQFMVATTLDLGDDWTEKESDRLGVRVFRGSSEDVLARYAAASADLRTQDIVIRATADNPFYCPQRTAAIVRRHRASRCDYTCIRSLSYVVPEVMRAGALREMSDPATDAECREHVTPYFRRSAGIRRFRVEQLSPTWRGLRPEIRLTVDTLSEYERARRIQQRLAHANGATFVLDDVYRAVDDRDGLRRAA